MAAILERKKQSEEDRILAELQYIKSRINTSSGILSDRDKTAFFFGVTPESAASRCRPPTRGRSTRPLEPRC